MTLKLNNFDLPDLDAWRKKIKDEKKSKKTALYFNEIEGLSFDANDKSQNQNFNTFRSSKINDWQIAANVLVKDEKKANKLALQCLGQGVNLLYLDLQEKSINWALLLKDIHLNFIRIVVNLKSTEQLLSLNQFVDDSDKKTFSISVGKTSNITESFLQKPVLSKKISSYGMTMIFSSPNTSEYIWKYL